MTALFKKIRLLKTVPILLLGLSLSIPAAAAGADIPSGNYGREPVNPGALNYVEGTAHLQGKLLKNSGVGSVVMAPGQVLSTQKGRVEILLIPGVYLRVGAHSAVKMISPELNNTKVQLVRGEAGVEVDEIHSQNNLVIVDNGVDTQLAKRGFYEFIASPPKVLAFSGQAEVQVNNGKYKKVTGEHEMGLGQGAKHKARKFNINDAKDQLYQWSKSRSQYEAEAYNQMGGEYNGWSGYYPGWYWDPYMMGYAYGGGPFWSPFGWGAGFYPGYWGPGYWGGPWWGPGVGFYGGFYPGFYGGGFYRHYDFDRDGDFHRGMGFHGGGFHGRAFHGGLHGGFHGGESGEVHDGGGFHGGGRR
jgi:hypothetical protein